MSKTIIAECRAALQAMPDGPYSAEFTYAWFVCYAELGTICQCVDEADARIIAALLNCAPAMLDAAERMLTLATQLPYVHEATAQDVVRAMLLPLHTALCGVTSC
jgi:hypothetical protein